MLLRRAAINSAGRRLQSTERKCKVYVSPFPVTLMTFKAFSPIANPFKCDFAPYCAAVDLYAVVANTAAIVSQTNVIKGDIL